MTGSLQSGEQPLSGLYVSRAPSGRDEAFGSGSSRHLAEPEPEGSGKLAPLFIHSPCFHEALGIECLADRLQDRRALNR